MTKKPFFQLHGKYLAPLLLLDLYNLSSPGAEKGAKAKVFQTHNDAAKAVYISSDQEQLFSSVCYISIQLPQASRVKGVSNRINTT